MAPMLPCRCGTSHEAGYEPSQFGSYPGLVAAHHSAAVHIERQAGGQWVPISRGDQVQAGETVNLVATGFLPVSTVTFTVRTATAEVFTQQAGVDGTRVANTTFVVPSTEGSYSVDATGHTPGIFLLEAFLPEETVSTSFYATARARRIQPPPSDENPLQLLNPSNLKPILYVGLGILALVYLGPALRGIGKKVSS